MNRLTYKDASGKWVLNSRNFYWPKCGLPVHLSGEAVERLAEYENIGSVNELRTLKNKEIAEQEMSVEYED